jgi:hypothetical protein
MFAPAGLVTVWDLNVDGNDGCAAAANPNNAVPRAAVMRSCLIMASPDLSCDWPARKGIVRSRLR